MLIEWMRSTADERTVWMSPVRDDNAQTRHVFLYLFTIGFLWAGSLYLYVLSLEYTTAVRATLFSNTQPVLLLLYYRYVKKVKHSTGEILGVFVAFAGIAMAMLERRQRSTSDALIGDLMNLVVACIMSSNIVLAGRVRKTVPIFMYTVVTVSVQTIFLMIITLAAENSEISMARRGLFGWLDTKYTKSFMLVGFLGGYFGILGRNFAVARIHPVVISVFSLFGPIFTVWLVYIVGLEGLFFSFCPTLQNSSSISYCFLLAVLLCTEIPKTWTIVGGCTVLFGIFLVVFFEHLRSRHEKQSQDRAAFEAQLRLDAELALPSFASDMEEFSTHDFSCPGPVPVDSPAI
jgi:drug/metabolite transporter (DMT)-like permease